MNKNYELTPEIAAQIIKNNVYASIDTLRTLKEVFYEGKIQPQQFGVTDSCHYSIICMINHSCINNCRFFFIGSVVFMLACRDIPQGGEILDSYYPQTQTMADR